jgi:hypothetical protein
MARKVILVAVLATLVAMAFAVPGFAANRITVLHGTFPSNEEFLVNGVPTLYTFSCNEVRVQAPNGSALDTASCQLYASETPPSSFAFQDEAAGYESDFYVNNAPGFTGSPIASDWGAVVTPSGHVFMVAYFAAP